MAAAMVGRHLGERIQKGDLPKEYARFGSTVEELFADLRLLKGLYGDEAARFSPGAIGVFSYLNRVAVGLRQMMALNRVFSLEHISRADLIPLTEQAARVSGLPTCEELLARELERL